MGLVFAEEDMEVMRRVREVFNPRNLLQSGKFCPPARIASITRQPGFEDLRQQNLNREGKEEQHTMDWNKQPMIIDRVVLTPDSCRPMNRSIRIPGGQLVTRQPLTPCGGCTQLRLGNPPNAGTALGLARLDRVVAHEAEDFFVTVQGGAPGLSCSKR